MRNFHGTVLGLLRGHIYKTCQNPQFHLEKVALMMMLVIMIFLKVMLSSDNESNIEFESLRLWRV